MRHAILTALLSLPLPVAADVTVRFIEGAPKDSFVFSATGCPVGAATLTVDLATAPAGLIFDVTANGAGVEVFQPVELVDGTARIAEVRDGDQVLALSVPAFGPDQPVTITTDIDDTQTNGPSGQIIVAGSEIAGATARIDTTSGRHAAEFDTGGIARIVLPGCLG